MTYPNTHGTYTTSYSSQSFTKAFELPYPANQPDSYLAIYGSAKYEFQKLPDKNIHKNHLAVNLTGTGLAKKPFILKAPKAISAICSQYNYLVDYNELLLDWPDMGIPSSNIDLTFYTHIVKYIISSGIQEVYVFCQAGQGRTGTFIAALVYAWKQYLQTDTTMYSIIAKLRKDYSPKCIETQGQLSYLNSLSFDSPEDKEKVLADFSSKAISSYVPKTTHSHTSHSSSTQTSGTTMVYKDSLIKLADVKQDELLELARDYSLDI